MWFPLLFVSNTLICRQVNVYASPPELVKQVYMSMTTSPVLWAKKDLNLRLPRYQRGTLNHLSYLPIKYNSNHIANSEHPWKLYFCGPEGNRTLHNLLAREFRQPWYMQAQNCRALYIVYFEHASFQPHWTPIFTLPYPSAGIIIRFRFALYEVLVGFSLHFFVLGTGFEPVSHAWKAHRLDH